MAHYDILIKGGMIIDGKRNAMKVGSVGINGDKIKYVGSSTDNTGEMEIDASQKYVTPGFIDLTNHSDTHWRLFTNPGQESMLYQGITTILGGNCGASLAPLANIEALEGIEKWVDTKDININWQSMEEFFAELEKQKFGVNFATLVGYSTLRLSVKKDKEGGFKEIDPSALDQMRLLMERSLKAGAFGFSTSLGTIYEKLASQEEIVEIMKVVARHDGLSKHHLRDEGINILPAISEIIGFARKSGSRCQISHLKTIGRRGAEHAGGVLEMIDLARKEGLPVGYDVFPYTSTGSNLFMLLPEWTLSGDNDAILKNIRDPQKKETIIESLKEMTLHYDRIIVASSSRDTASIGKSILELSQNAGKSPEEVVLDILDINDLRVGIFNEIISSENLDKFINKEYASISTDGVGYSRKEDFEKDLPHPRSFGSYPKALVDFVKNKKLFSWEEAIYKITGLPASVLSLKDRGVLSKGAVADVVVFDPENIEDKATYVNPYQFSKGVEWVIVNGKPTIENGNFNNNLNGRILKKN